MVTRRQKVRAALKVPSSELQEHCTTDATQALGLSYVARRSSELGAAMKEQIWALLEGNMRTLSESSSIGWNPKEKRAETLNRLSRFILVFQGDEPVASQLVAFAMFRFEIDDEEGEECLLYCYELQISEAMRGMGIGRALITMLEDIGSTWEMEKVKLMVLKANENAVQFYKRTSFIADESCPSKYGKEVDYEILSKRLPEEEDEWEEDGSEEVTV